MPCTAHTLACYLRVVSAADVLAEEGFVDRHTILEAHLNENILKAAKHLQQSGRQAPWWVCQSAAISQLAFAPI
jgi:hypothetical protein